jgi:hypothetical protein
VPNLTGQTVGPKPAKTPRKGRKPLPRQSAKKRAYMASAARVDGLAHMAAVAQLPCYVCGAWPVEVHHLGKPRDDMRVLPLCPQHHRREYGPGSYHWSPSAFHEAHGDIDAILRKVARMLGGT